MRRPVWVGTRTTWRDWIEAARLPSGRGWQMTMRQPVTPSRRVHRHNSCRRRTVRPRMTVHIPAVLMLDCQRSFKLSCLYGYPSAIGRRMPLVAHSGDSTGRTRPRTATECHGPEQARPPSFDPLRRSPQSSNGSWRSHPRLVTVSCHRRRWRHGDRFDDACAIITVGGSVPRSANPADRPRQSLRPGRARPLHRRARQTLKLIADFGDEQLNVA